VCKVRASGGDKYGKLPTSAENSKVLNDLKMLRDG